MKIIYLLIITALMMPTTAMATKMSAGVQLTNKSERTIIDGVTQKVDIQLVNRVRIGSAKIDIKLPESVTLVSGDLSRTVDLSVNPLIEWPLQVIAPQGQHTINFFVEVNRKGAAPSYEAFGLLVQAGKVISDKSLFKAAKGETLQKSANGSVETIYMPMKTTIIRE